MEDICNVFIKKYQIFRTYCEVHHSVESTTIMSMNQWCNDIAMWVYVSIAYSATKKEQIFIIIATVTICSCIESADELFQHTLGHECMEDAVNTISIYVYMSIAYSAFSKKADFHSFSCRYHLQLHWSCWQALPAHLGSWMHGTGCQYFLYMCIDVYCLFRFENSRFS